MISSLRFWSHSIYGGAREGRAVHLFSSLLTAFFLAGVALAGIIWCFADIWVSFLVPGFGEAAQKLTVGFVRVMSLTMPAWVLCGGLISLEVSKGRPRATSLRAPVLNAAAIVGIGVMAATGQVLAIGWSLVIGFNAVSAYGTLMLWRDGEIRFRAISKRNMLDAFREVGQGVKPLLVQPLFEQGNVFWNGCWHPLQEWVSSPLWSMLERYPKFCLFLVAQPLGYVVLSAGEAAKARAASIARVVLGVSVPPAVYFAVFRTRFNQCHVRTRQIRRTCGCTDLSGITWYSPRALGGNAWERPDSDPQRQYAQCRRSEGARGLVRHQHGGNVVVVASGLRAGPWRRDARVGASTGCMIALRNGRELAPVLIEQSVMALTLTTLCLTVDVCIDTALGTPPAGASIVSVVSFGWCIVRVPELHNLVFRRIRNQFGES